MKNSLTQNYGASITLYGNDGVAKGSSIAIYPGTETKIGLGECTAKLS